MHITRYSIQQVNEAIQAIQNIKCIEDGIPFDMITPSVMEEFLGNPFNYLIVALEDDKAVGYIIAYELQRIDREESMMFYYDTSVLSLYRHRGVGTAMTEYIKEICLSNKMMKMFVPTLRSNVPAVGLYEKTGAFKSVEQDEVFLTWNFHSVNDHL